MPTELLVSGPTDASATLLLAHGAGGAMDSVWLNEFCGMLAARGIRTVRFEFPYMAARRTGTRRPAPKAEISVAAYREAVALVADRPLFIGGKSYGGRVASMLAQELVGTIAGLVCLSYPFHPAGKPEQLRTAHLKDLTVPTLICQGTRDPFGSAAEVPGYGLSPSIEVHWLEDGEHEWRPRKAISGRTAKQNLEEAADAVATFCLSHG
ncbi:MAG: alpha/beta family hydrolase [Rhodoglobus sp.]